MPLLQFLTGTFSWWHHLTIYGVTLSAVLVASAYVSLGHHLLSTNRKDVKRTRTTGETTPGSNTGDAGDESTSDSNAEHSPKKLLDKSEYTVGWICAIRPEYKAAQLFLDERHQVPDDLPQHDMNDYTLGKIGKHNIAIAVLPNGAYGTINAANVAKDMMNTFTNIRIGLMVGIAGGVPSHRHDIRLGDVVVSTRTGRNSAVLQYDHGKSIQDQKFIIQGSLRPPPTFLETAVAGLDVHYQEGHGFDKIIKKKLKENPRLKMLYGKPDQDSDRLFKHNVKHPINDERSCEVVCDMRDKNLVQRAKRSNLQNNPAIHYGVIASGNSLMKDAVFRDMLSADEDILCFEMEAAGLMDQFPCLVIRGICD